jgi:hypothetical protein
MKNEKLSEAIGEVNAEYISEAINYKPSFKTKIILAPFWKKAVAVMLCLCLIVVLQFNSLFSAASVTAYAYGTNEELTKAGTVLSSGTISDDGNMKGHPLQFYIVGNGIKSIRYSCKNQWIDFVDWTEARDEYGVGKNFTVPYGKDKSQYYYLVIDWVPNDTIRMLTDNKEIGIKDLPAELRQDIIVMEITFENGKTATKAVSVELRDNGSFAASFNDYSITEQDEFIKSPDSKPIDRKDLYKQGSRNE